jgi:hypothetical protein
VKVSPADTTCDDGMSDIPVAAQLLMLNNNTIANASTNLIVFFLPNMFPPFSVKNDDNQ